MLPVDRFSTNASTDNRTALSLDAVPLALLHSHASGRGFPRKMWNFMTGKGGCSGRQATIITAFVNPVRPFCLAIPRLLLVLHPSPRGWCGLGGVGESLRYAPDVPKPSLQLHRKLPYDILCNSKLFEGCSCLPQTLAAVKYIDSEEANNDTTMHCTFKQ